MFTVKKAMEMQKNNAESRSMPFALLLGLPLLQLLVIVAVGLSAGGGDF